MASSIGGQAATKQAPPEQDQGGDLTTGTAGDSAADVHEWTDPSSPAAEWIEEYVVARHDVAAACARIGGRDAPSSEAVRAEVHAELREQFDPASEYNRVIGRFEASAPPGFEEPDPDERDDGQDPDEYVREARTRMWAEYLDPGRDEYCTVSFSHDVAQTTVSVGARFRRTLTLHLSRQRMLAPRTIAVGRARQREHRPAARRRSSSSSRTSSSDPGGEDPGDSDGQSLTARAGIAAEVAPKTRSGQHRKSEAQLRGYGPQGFRQRRVLIDARRPRPDKLVQSLIRRAAELGIALDARQAHDWATRFGRSDALAALDRLAAQARRHATAHADLEVAS